MLPAASCGRPTARCRPSSGSSPCRPASPRPSCRAATVALRTSTAKRYSGARRPSWPARSDHRQRRAASPSSPNRPETWPQDNRPAHPPPPRRQRADEPPRNRTCPQLTSLSRNPSGAKVLQPRRGPGRQHRRNHPEQRPDGRGVHRADQPAGPHSQRQAGTFSSFDPNAARREWIPRVPTPSLAPVRRHHEAR